MSGDKCYEGGIQHKYEPRYDEVDSNRNAKIEIQAETSPEELRKMLVLRLYIGEVCTWCGKTRPRRKHM